MMERTSVLGVGAVLNFGESEENRRMRVSCVDAEQAGTRGSSGSISCTSDAAGSRKG
jgi:hypothetical protein